MRKSLVIRRGTAWQLAAVAGLSPLFVAAASEAQTFQVSIAVRETQWVPPVVVGGNGGTTNGIEWINLDGLTLTADGSWQQFTFNFGTDPVTAFAGATANGVLDGTTGTIEHIRLRNIGGVTDVVSLQIDDIVNTVSGTPITVSGFETTDANPATLGTEHIFQEPRFSGSTQAFLANLPNATLVTDQQFHTGAQSNQADFAFNTSNPASWLRLTTFNTPNQPNPAIDYSAGNSLSFWLRMTIAPPAQRWINTGSGDWDDTNNWGTNVVPNAVGATANFLGDITAPATITLNNPITVTTIRLQSDNAYTIVGGPSNNVLTLDGNAEDARTVNVQQGSHTIAAPVMVNLGVGTSAQMNFNVSRAQDVLTVSGDVTINITNNATLTIQKTGPGRLDITNLETPDTLTQPTNLAVNGGTLRFLPGSGLNRVNALSIAGGTTPTAQLDITNNPVVVDYPTPVPPATSPFATLKAQIAAGYAGGSWNGNGIMSSQANANNFAVGYAEASTLASVPAIFGTVDADAVLIRLTRYGDANLDGTVNLQDFNRLAANFGVGDDWVEGDFTYDNLVNLADFNKLAANFGLSAAGPTVTPQDWARLGAAIPEPTSLALLGAGALLGMRRRRRA
jgi:hypothetical protein